MDIRGYFASKKPGFYVTLAGMILSLALAIVYVAMNGGGDSTMDNMSWPAFALLLVGFVAALALVVVKLDAYAAAAMSLFHIVSLGLYIYAIYMYVSAAMVGIDSSWTPSFFIITILYVAGLVVNLTGFCLSTPVTASFAKTKKGVASATAILLSVLLAGTVIANENPAQINSALNITTSYYEGGDENVDSEYFKSSYENLSDLMKDGQALGEEVMGEGIVLLRNENVDGEPALPLKEGARNVSFFGMGAVDPVYGGTGSGAVDTSTAPTFKSAFERNSLFSVNASLWDWYASQTQYKRQMGSTGNGVTGIKVMGEAPWNEVDNAFGSSYQQYGDAAIVVLSRVGGEGSDMPRGDKALNKLNDSTGSGGDSTQGDYLKLSPKEIDLLEGLKAEKDAGNIDRIVLLLNTANQIEADFIDDAAYGIDAALWIGTPGQTGLYAVAEVLAGTVNPSGSLPDTFWRSHELNPSLANFGVYTYEGASDAYNQDGTPNQDRSYVVYQEGIYVGYRYTETRYEDYVMNTAKTGNFDYGAAVAYPFGSGLSYSDFEYSEFTVEEGGTAEEPTYVISVKVTNNGPYAGKETVQIYLQKPYGDYNTTNGVEAAAVELVGFDKTELLSVGDSETLTIEVSQRQFASYDANKAETYVLTPGDYYLTAAADAHDAVNNILAKKGYSPQTTDGRMDTSGNAALVGEKITLSEDAEKYSESAATGNEITNQFEFSDWNKYANKGSDVVEYMTRSDWEGTVPSGVDDHVVLHWSNQLGTDLNALGRKGETKLPEDNGEYPTYGSKETSYKLIDLRADEEGNLRPYDDPMWEDILDQLTWDEQVELVRYGMRMTGQINSIDKKQTLDHNGPSGLTEKYSSSRDGLANKTKDPLRTSQPMCYPASGVLAATCNLELMYKVGDMIGEDALWAGYNGLYGPGSNIHRTPYSGRNFEYYSEDGYLSGMICAYECAGMEANGLYVYNKHIGLNDQEDQRRGICTWANEQSIREIYMRAFELPITIDGQQFEYEDETITLKGASGVMTAFNRMGLYWSSMNAGLMTGFLREECGMTGIAVTDMWYGEASNYMNLPAMLVAGTNLVDGSQEASQLNASRTNHADVAWAMRESVHRILYTVVQSNAMNGVTVGSKMITVTPWWQIVLVAANVALGVGFVGSVAWTVVDEVRSKKRREAAKQI